METRESIITKIKKLEKELEEKQTETDAKKLQINGSFGKLGSKFSYLYAPELLLQTTITGQLCLLMLIERMEDAGISIVSANTDGIVIHTTKNREHEMEVIAWEWMLDTSFVLERTDYRLISSRDVNTYCAVKTDGKVKRKGAFNVGGLMKNPDRNIVFTAVVNFLKDGTPLEETIKGCKDPAQFVTVRTVKGGARWNGEDIGKAVRFYSSTDSFFEDPCITYVLNGNKVPRSTGCRPLMEMGNTVPEDLNYQSYIDDAEKLLTEVGYVCTSSD